MATYLTARDNEPLILWVTDRNGPVQINQATSVRFGMKVDGGPVIGGDVEVLDDGTVSLRGKGRYVWASGQTDTPGAYRAEVQVVWPDGRRETFPSKRPEDIIIRPDIVT